ncbi:MAG: hypothetical protein Q8L37_02745 [Candidatus Gottesmanbacteria bacterium]|nr:hypothetical protein [Candidatus Gottesmanbacteria bacterium]
MIVLIVSAGLTLINSAHVIIQWTLNKPGETFTGIAHSFADYFLYVGAMAQGAAGRWIWMENLFTNEPTNLTWYYWFYVSLGHIGSWGRLSPFATYNVSLFLFVIALCLVWYKLTKLLYPTNTFLRLTTWLLILTSTNFISFARPGLAKLGILGFSQMELLGQFWFSPAPVFSRLGGVPYHVVQSILFILLAITFSHLLASKSITRDYSGSHGNMLAWLQNKKLRSFLSLVILAAIAASANPVQMLVFGVAALITTAVMTNAAIYKKIALLVCLFIAAGAGAWLTQMEFSRQAVFLAARSWELVQQVRNNPSILILSIGPVLLFIPFGMQKVFKEKNPLHILFVIWGLLSFALFLSPIPRLLALSPVRFLHPVPYAAALAILGVEGLVQLAGLLHRRLKNKVTLTTIRVALLLAYLILTIPAISRQFIDRITPARNPQLLMDTIYNHVPAPIADALTWLRVTGPGPVIERPVVLVDPAIPIEVLVPVFTGKISFSGHPIHTLYPDVKEAKRQKFFGGKMSETEANQFLKDHRIGYIISKPISPTLADYSKFVTMVFQNDVIAIFKTMK